jgi:broad specificity phosphatase PhoE
VIKTKNFKQAESILSKSLINKVRNIQYRQKTKKLGNILEQLNIDQDKLSFSFSSWQQLAKDYIKKKYPDNYQEYLEVAQELGVL